MEVLHCYTREGDCRWFPGCSFALKRVCWQEQHYRPSTTTKLTTLTIFFHIQVVTTSKLTIFFHPRVVTTSKLTIFFHPLVVTTSGHHLV
jgi:hypothetical protein